MVEIVCFGDSVTYGQGLDDPTVDAFPAVLSRLLDVGVANRGYCGDTTRVALERFPRDVQESGAAVVVVQFGHNDCNRWQTDNGLPRVSLAGFRANLVEMRERARAAGIRTLFLAPYPTGKPAGYEQDRREYTLAMVGLGGAVRTEVTLLDRIHPDENGHRQIAYALLPHLEPAA